MATLSPEQVHKYMSAISSKDTRPEMIVRRWLWMRGFRYRLHHPRGFLGILISCCVNTVLVFLLMVAFGMGTMDVGFLKCLRQILHSGKLK